METQKTEEEYAEVTAVHPPQKSRDGIGYYTRIEFRRSNGEYAYTYIVGDYTNKPKWQEVIKRGAGAKIAGYTMKKTPNGLMNADSNIRLILPY